MTIALTINGATFNYPESDDVDWGGAATAWASAVTSGMLQKAGGDFTLLGNVNFGPNFGLLSQHFTSRTADASTVGLLRLAGADSIGFRNAANTGNLLIGVALDVLQFNGEDLIAGPIVNADVAANAAISFSKLEVLPSTQMIVGNGSGVATAQPITGDVLIDNLGETRIATGVIINADINNAAAIAYSKLNLTSSIVNADITSSAAILGTKISPDFGNQAIISQQHVQLSEIATPTTPAANQVRLYPKADGNFYKIDDTGVEQPLGGGGGAGELNLIDDPSAIGTTWANEGVTTVTTTTAAELPLAGVIETAIKLSGGSAAQYSRGRFSVPQSLYNTKLKLEWYQRAFNVYTNGQMKVELYTNNGAAYSGSYVRVPLSTDSSGDTLIPNVNGKISTTYDTGELELYEIRIVRVSGTGQLALSNVITGPGIQPFGAVVSAWESYVPVLTGFGTVTSLVAFKRRVGSSQEIIGGFLPGTTTAVEARLALDSGLTVFAPGTGTNPVGDHSRAVASNNGTAALLATNGNSFLQWGQVVQGSNTNELIARNANDLYSSGERATFRASVPITEWQGSGTVNLGANNVEYAYNTDLTNATDSTSFGYGPQGVRFSPIATTAKAKHVRFQTPIMPTDTVEMQVSRDTGTTWQPLGEFAATPRQFFQTTTNYGVNVNPSLVNNTDVEVNFQPFRHASGGVYGAAGVPWSDVSTNPIFLWRVVKTKAEAAVGFGLAQGGQTGLVAYNQTELTGASNQLTGGTFKFSRVNNQVTMSFEGITHSSLSTALSAVGYVPLEYRSALLVRVIYDMQPASGNNNLKRVIVYTTGQIQFNYLNWTGTAISVTNGESGTISWTI